MKIIAAFLCAAGMLFTLTACGTDADTSELQNTKDQSAVLDSAGKNPDTTMADSGQIVSQTEEKEENNMVIIFNGKEYAVQTEDNVTAADIMAQMPLDLTMTQYAGHEYYAELDFRPEFAGDRTSQIQAGHIYYWDGWNAFVVNYIDWHIAPYEVVHIGEITDKTIVDELLETDGTIMIAVKGSEELN